VSGAPTSADPGGLGSVRRCTLMHDRNLLTPTAVTGAVTTLARVTVFGRRDVGV